MTKRIVTLFVLIVTLMLLSGCNSDKNDNSELSFEDTNILAYIDDTPVYLVDEQYFVDIKQRYMADVVNIFEEKGETVGSMLLLYLRAKEYAGLNDQQKTEDYYRSIIIQRYVTTVSDGYYVDSMVEYSIDIALKMENDMMDVTTIVSDLAEKYNYSYEDSVDIFYKPFITSEFANEELSYYFNDNIYGEQLVVWAGNNFNEYEKSSIEFLKQYNMFIAEIVNDYTITEAP